LEIIETGKWKLCLQKEGSIEYYPENPVFSISDECKINYFYFNKKLFKKKIFLVPDNQFDPNYFSEIKSNQLDRKAHWFLEKWKEKLKSKIKREWLIINSRIPSNIKKEYVENNLTKANKHLVRKIICNINIDSNSNKKIQIQNKAGEGKRSKKTSDDPEIELTTEDIKTKIKKIKNSHLMVNIGDFWMNDAILKEETDEGKKYYEKTEEDFYAERNIVRESHCKCCKMKQLTVTVSTQTDNNITHDIVEKCDVSMETMSLVQRNKQIQCDDVKESVDMECQTDNMEHEKIIEKEKENLEQQVEKTPKSKVISNLRFEHLMSDSILLGSPTTKRSRELATVYDELNSVFGKLSKVAGKRMIKTPDTSYISYRYFEQQDIDDQFKLIQLYRGLIKFYKQLRGLMAENFQGSQSFTEEMATKMNQAKSTIVSLDMFLKQLDKKNENFADLLITKDNNLEDSSKEIHGVIGDYMLENTPQEGNSTAILSFNDDLINSLM
jgi:hypothetical protein